MKKHFKFLLGVFAFLTFAITSCSNEKLMTEAEMAKKVSEATESKTKALETQLDQECESGMDASVKAAVDSIIAAKKAEIVQ